MLLQRSRLTAATVERPRLAPPWSIALLGTMVLAVLVAIYPHEALIERVLAAPPGGITEAYLANLLRTDPTNPQLRVMLARNQLHAGLHERVATTLAPALAASDPQLRREALWLLWQSEEARYQRLPEDARERPALRRALRDKLGEIAAQAWNENILAEIARKAIEFGDTPLGLRLFDQLAAAGTGRTDFWYAEAAQAALGEGEYRAAAEFYLIAREKAATLAEQRRYFLAALRAMQSGDRGAEALEMAEREIIEAPELADDGATLELIVRLARAARRPDLADRYARRLLRLSLREQWQRAQLAQRGFDARPQRVALAGDEKAQGTTGTQSGGRAGAATPGGPQLPFDDKIYTLGYEAFLDNRKLEDAWQVAAAAVRQAPDHLVWRERLARVAEWSGRPQAGLDNWLYIARATNRDDAWQNVLRLAPGLFADEALRAALQYQLGRQPQDARLLRELAATYERLGDPQGGLRFLESALARSRQDWMLETMAELAERGGDEERALRYWQRFLADDDARLTPARAVRVATLLLLRGRPDDGLALLEKAQAGAGADDIAFWRLNAELARLVQNDRSAVGAYRRIVGHADAGAADYDALYQLLLDDYPREAAQVAAAAWRRFRQLPPLVQALTLHAAGERWTEMRQLDAEPDARQLAALRRRADFLQLSAQYRMQEGQPALARRDLETALQIAPDAPDVQLALLWLLIDSGDGGALRNALATWEGGWRDNPALHDALGAAYLALSLPDVALRRYYTPRLAEHRDDFLWLMNYADALEQNQDSDRAWRLRQQLLAQERQRTARREWLAVAPDAGAEGALQRIARARLSIVQRSGEHGFAVLRELLRLDRDGDRKLSPAARDIALGWLQERAEYAAERGWLWQQYARTVARPLWAEVSLALAANDRETAGQLLERHGERLPRYDRINVARLADDLRLAQSDAFDAQSAQPADDPLHLQLSDALLAHSDQIGGAFANRDVGSVGERERAARWHLALSPRLALDLALGSIARSNRDAAVIGSTPDESYRSARLAWRHADGETRLGVEQRKSFASYTPLLLEHGQRLDERLGLFGALGVQQAASESTALRVAGMKDIARIGLRYRPTQRDQIGLEHAWSRYAVQTGTRLGDGRVWQVEAAHALRIEPRDLEASAFWSSHRYDRRDGAFAASDAALQALLPAGSAPADVGGDFFLPDGFRYYGLRLSTDTRFEREYTRAWRPYASVAKTWHSSLGAGYDLAAGIAGNVFGADHLAFGWKLGKGGATSGGLVREIGLTYRLHY